MAGKLRLDPARWKRAEPVLTNKVTKSTSSPISDGVGDRPGVKTVSVCNQPPRPTQPSIPPG